MGANLTDILILEKKQPVKKIILPLLLMAAITVSAQDNCVIVLNGKELSTEDVITKEDAAHFCSLVFRDAVAKKDLPPVAYNWVASNNGQILKGTLAECNRLTEAAIGMMSGDVLYIEEIKYKGLKGQCKSQFVLRMK